MASIKRSLIVFFSILLVFVGGGGFVFFCYHLQSSSDRYQITALMQTNIGDSLPTAYLAEIMGLSCDEPCNFHRFYTKKAEQKLLASPLIKKCRVKKYKPNIVYVDYQLCSPVAYLVDYANTAMDEEGTLFPFLPFYTPKRLPKVFLGERAPESPWGKQLSQEDMSLILYFVGLGKDNMLMNLSYLRAPSIGLSQIIVHFEEEGNVERILRLSKKGYKKEILHYESLQKEILLQDSAIIDLRLTDVAYIDKKECL